MSQEIKKKYDNEFIYLYFIQTNSYYLIIVQ